MAEILRLLFQFHSEYSGDPRFISGNALRHALSQQVNSSIGIFTDIAHLKTPLSYSDFFHIRTKKYFVFPHFEKFYDWNSCQESYRYFFTPEYVTFDVLDAPNDLVEYIHSLEPLQFGGQRHSGYGAVKLHDSTWIDLDEIIMPAVASHISLISPIIYLPPFVEKFNCRREQLNIWNYSRNNQVEVIAPRQFFRLKPNIEIPKLALNGILRKVKANKGLFSQFGFGEFIIHNWRKGDN